MSFNVLSFLLACIYVYFLRLGKFFNFFLRWLCKLFNKALVEALKRSA